MDAKYMAWSNRRLVVIKCGPCNKRRRWWSPYREATIWRHNDGGNGRSSWWSSPQSFSRNEPIGLSMMILSSTHEVYSSMSNRTHSGLSLSWCVESRERGQVNREWIHFHDSHDKSTSHQANYFGSSWDRFYLDISGPNDFPSIGIDDREKILQDDGRIWFISHEDGTTTEERLELGIEFHQCCKRQHVIPDAATRILENGVIVGQSMEWTVTDESHSPAAAITTRTIGRIRRYQPFEAETGTHILSYGSVTS